MLPGRLGQEFRMHQTFDHVHLSAHGKIAVITLAHPLTVNALSEPLAGGLNAALDALQAGSFRALVLTGEGRGFCSGADMNELPTRRAEGAAKVLERLYHPLFRRLRDLEMPLVTAVNGAAVGIGMSMALMGDLVVAAQSAYFLLSFTRIGLVPDGGATWLLPRLIGLARARDLALLAEKLPAARALEWGLINRVVEDARLMDEAIGLAQRLADGPAALPLTRKLFWDETGYEAQLAREAAAQEIAGETADFAEGLAAFQQKREAKFTGK
jgi:2-(1,2-epoxy-1,2-dihydrophenyl)acetyl-CoA isomerase